MVDQVPDDPREETGPLVRPYIPASPQYGMEADGLWPQERDERPGPVAAEGASGDVLFTDWTPGPGQESAAQYGDTQYGDTQYGDAQAGYRDQDDHADHDGRDNDGRDDHAGYDAYRGDPDAPGRRKLGPDRSPYVSAADGGAGPAEDGGTEPKGFLGSGWRSQPDPEEPEEGPRGGVLLRVGGIGVAVAAVIWALAAWVGGPGEQPCAACAAEPPAAASPVPAEPADEQLIDPDPTEAAPAEPEPSAAPTPPAAVSPRAVVPTVTSTAAPTAPTTPSVRPSHRSPADSSPTVVIYEPTQEQLRSDPPADPPSEPPSEPPATSEPTSAPDDQEQEATPPPADEEPPVGEERKRRGLFGWLF